ncbi:uncharacterized protein LJ264_005081 [Porphyrio hochstetteri]
MWKCGAVSTYSFHDADRKLLDLQKCCMDIPKRETLRLKCIYPINLSHKKSCTEVPGRLPFAERCIMSSVFYAEVNKEEWICIPVSMVHSGQSSRRTTVRGGIHL